MTHIVVAGGGFGGAYCARELGRKVRIDEAQVTLINRSNFFVFTPLLVEAGTGALEPRHAIVPLRQFVRRAQLHTAEVTAIDLSGREVRTRTFDGGEHSFIYDHLVIALGSITRLPNVPGLREHGFGLKSLADAVALRDRAVGMLELANETPNELRRRAMLTFVVVGGNYTGVEVAGEFNEFLTEATRLYQNVDPKDIRIVLVDHEPRILHSLDEDLSRYASERLRKRGVELRLTNSVTRIDAENVELKEGEKVSTWTVIWTAGITPSPLLGTLDVPLDRHGALSCTPEMRVTNLENVWAVGDCAAIPDPQGNSYPATAQHAIREGRQVADNIARSLRGQVPRPLVYRSKGMMAPLGMRQGVARVFSWRLSGTPAWFVWRTFYLSQMPGFGRKLRVLIDWTLDWFFRRDYVQLGIHGSHQPLPGGVTIEHREDDYVNQE
jgi:NADH dehydrogenase